MEKNSFSLEGFSPHCNTLLYVFLLLYAVWICYVQRTNCIALVIVA